MQSQLILDLSSENCLRLCSAVDNELLNIFLSYVCSWNNVDMVWWKLLGSKHYAANIVNKLNEFNNDESQAEIVCAKIFISFVPNLSNERFMNTFKKTGYKTMNWTSRFVQFFVATNLERKLGLKAVIGEKLKVFVVVR